ncbi:hypothetical protein BJL95_02030 [Methylomonas sp. LWB]|uniref:Nmad2 family putative nucleotide modification protein n=1 Tax=unclassified Methylomonas TaxID=2608980 RepID=UPI0008DA8CD7|nr:MULTISPECIES: hypothetical protein [unclassified Methylomonas]MDT4329135.1 hypothetical protein [Methylomonas sp. MV1]OHX36681.1 hypothetical protein BJL95_02030 [Methylomonas sp. LWB]
MLIENGTYLYTYAITRDYGFAPNPFHGICTLATCKPDIRKSANIGDWILGIGGSNMNSASRKCIFLMKVTKKISFQEYWHDPIYSIKKPLRNGSQVRMVGDNIYHVDLHGNWLQEDSHHSNPDGSINHENLKRDAGKTDDVLLSDKFLYFGHKAIEIDLDSIGYHHRIRNYTKNLITESNNTGMLLNSILEKHQKNLNLVISDPCHFKDSHKRVDQKTGKLS